MIEHTTGIDCIKTHGRSATGGNNHVKPLEHCGHPGNHALTLKFGPHVIVSLDQTTRQRHPQKISAKILGALDKIGNERLDVVVTLLWPQTDRFDLCAKSCKHIEGCVHGMTDVVIDSRIALPEVPHHCNAQPLDIGP